MSDETQTPTPGAGEDLPRAKKTTPPAKGRTKKGKGKDAPQDAAPEVVKEALGLETMPDGRKVQRKIVTLKETLRCQLTPQEHLAKAQEMARAHNDVAAEIQRQTDVKTELKARLSRLEGILDELSTVVGSGHEWRTVIVSEVFSYATRTVTKVRTDTGETLSERGMSDQEMQMALPLKDDKKKAEDAAKAGKGTDPAKPLTAKVSEFPRVVTTPEAPTGPQDEQKATPRRRRQGEGKATPKKAAKE
jgi:hypothetical protein